MKVMKFGGSSVGSAANIEKAAMIVKDAAASNRCMVVVSAMQGTTDRLIEAGKTAEKGDDTDHVGAVAQRRRKGAAQSGQRAQHRRRRRRQEGCRSVMLDPCAICPHELRVP